MHVRMIVFKLDDEGVLIRSPICPQIVPKLSSMYFQLVPRVPNDCSKQFAKRFENESLSEIISLPRRSDCKAKQTSRIIELVDCLGGLAIVSYHTHMHMRVRVRMCASNGS